MVAVPQEKDASIRDLVHRLEAALGEETFVICDNWEADNFALGLAHPEVADLCAYVCTFGMPLGEYFVSLEHPSGQQLDVSSDEYDRVSFEELVEIVSSHLITAHGCGAA